MTAPIATLAPVLIPDDGLFKVGDDTVVAFVIVEGVVDAIVFEKLADLRDASVGDLTEDDDGSALSVGIFTIAFTPGAQVEKPR